MLVEVHVALLERIEIFELVVGPSGLGDGCHAGQKLILGQLLVRNVLRPEVTLHTDNVLLERLRGVVGHGVVAVDLVNGQVSADKTYVRALVLIVVEIVIVRGRHDGVESSLGSLLSAGHAAPAHDGCAGNDVALENFIPTYHISSLGLQVLGDDVEEMALRSEEHTSELQSRQYLVCR